MSLIAELKRRNVIRMAGLYLVGGWLVVQVAATLLPVFEAPGWVMKVLVGLLAVGFPAALVFSWVYELTPEGLKRDAEVAPERSIAPQTGRRMDALIVAGLLAVVAVVAADRFWPHATPATDAAADTAVASQVDVQAPAAPPQKSIAVLAFADLSPERDSEYFSDGIAEEILNALAKVKDLKVAGRTSSFHFKGRNESFSTIGEALGVAHVLEGSVRRQGERVRITAQLIQVGDGFHLWSEIYDGDLADVFALQERIARAIVDELKAVLQGGQEERLVNAGTTDIDAYALYLQATAIFNRRDGERFAEALAQLERAVALDPGFARAWSRMATLQVVMADYQGVDVTAALAATEAHARRALELDPSLAEPHAALGSKLIQQRRFREQREAFDRALALDPNDATANFWHALSLLRTGYTRQGTAALDRTLAIDPLLPNALLWRSYQSLYAGDLDDAERLLRRAADSGHASVALGLARLERARGNYAAAIEQYLHVMEYFSIDFPLQTLELFARASLGDAQAKPLALALIDDYLATGPDPIDGTVPFVLIRSGEVARGLALIQDQPARDDGPVVDAVFDESWPDARRAPEFAEFARRMGWAAYWDEFGPPDLCRKAANGDYVCE